ncbi:thymus-specific serine protease [Pelomyxa schiedti]|nr:thymus-specific serine protease [Pelomyxa schiedti]
MIEGPTRSSATATPDLWFTNQRVDHFDNTNTGTWNQRYLVNSTYWLGDGYPIIVNLGGEGTMGYTSVTGRFIFNTWAKQLSALIVSVEHRYYGQSMPTSDMSNANMPLLSSEQAIADYAVFINYIKTTYNAPHSEVLTAGGSYSGALSAWIRQKYPQIINTAYATSAPVFAKEDFTEYLEIVGAGLGTQCANAVKQGTLYYESLLQTPAGLEQIQKDFQTCTAIETENDKIVFMEYLADTISGFVQYNNDNNGYFPTNITGVCDMLLADDITVTYPQFILWYNDIFGEPCTPVSYADMVAELSITDPLAADPASRSWYWQTCSEFGYFQTGESSNQPFSSMISLQYFLDICYDVYGVSNTVVEMAIESTNNLYGGLNVGSSEIVFPNGSVDPWHALGLTQTTDPELPTVYIQGTAHCADMYAASPNDIPSLTTARSQVFSYITYWLN